jgi:hypothetical protein
MGSTMDYLANNPAWQTIAKGFPDAKLIFTAAEDAALAGTPWDANKFQSAIQNTDWFKQTPAGNRQYLFTQVFDPASATRDANTMARKILDFSNTMGEHISLQQGALLADAAITGNWDDARIQQEIVANSQFSPQMRLGWGTIAAAQTQIRGLAGDYGVNVAPQTAYDWGSKIADGLATTQSFTEYAKDQAKLAHPYWQDQLNQGMTVRQLADPYIQTAAKLLDINPATVNLSDPKWNSFTTTDDKGTVTPMSQQDWTKKVMTDPTYAYQQSTQGQTDAYNLVNSLKQGMGAQ